MIVEIKDSKEKQAISRKVLEALTDWFEIEESREEYISGSAVGFYCYSLNHETHEGMLKFVIVDASVRGKGIGKEMIKLAVCKAFTDPEVLAVQLNVFLENARAKRCYEGVGFAERHNTPDAFKYKDESWGRCNMIIKRSISG